MYYVHMWDIISESLGSGSQTLFSNSGFTTYYMILDFQSLLFLGSNEKNE
jgi:hypothetical protein